jgi:DNA-binding NarL/FixJ family response regulator
MDDSHEGLSIERLADGNDRTVLRLRRIGDGIDQQQPDPSAVRVTPERGTQTVRQAHPGDDQLEAPDVRIIAISVGDRHTFPAKAVELGAKTALPKPVVTADLVTAVRRALAVDG